MKNANFIDQLWSKKKKKKFSVFWIIKKYWDVNRGDFSENTAKMIAFTQHIAQCYFVTTVFRHSFVRELENIPVSKPISNRHRTHIFCISARYRK